MAGAYKARKEPGKAAELLFDARAEAEFEADPVMYAKILDLLRDILYGRGDYVQALEIKQEKYSLEQEFGLRAFIGAGFGGKRPGLPRRFSLQDAGRTLIAS